MDQILDKKTIGIPSDIELIRHETEVFKNEAGKYADDSKRSANESALYASQSKAHAQDANEAREEAVQAAENARQPLRSIQAMGEEPGGKFHGKLWLFTNEETKSVLNIYRYDEYNNQTGLFPADYIYPSNELFPLEPEYYSLYPSDDLYPDDDQFLIFGRWTELFIPFSSEGGTSDYRNLSNKPRIEGVELNGDKKLDQIGLDTINSTEISNLF